MILLWVLRKVYNMGVGVYNCVLKTNFVVKFVTWTQSCDDTIVDQNKRAYPLHL